MLWKFCLERAQSMHTKHAEREIDRERKRKREREGESEWVLTSTLATRATCERKHE